jgi:N6-L-threonylcarbamoyladenine synthase
MHQRATKNSIILAIETSCDETAVAIVTADGQILADQVLSQLEDHLPYGGVVPEIAARAHLDHLDGLVLAALNQADLTLNDIDAFAATGGPGLIGGVMVGVMTAKSLAFARQKPFLAINHLEGHALTARFSNRVDYPYLLLLVSGGHTQLIAVAGLGDYRLYGTTIDDAVGEAFDKGAKMLGLGYPGGPALERLALNGNPVAFDLPRPMLGRPDCHFSFSGLKTALRQQIQRLGEDAIVARADLAASYQAAIADALADRCRRGMIKFADEFGANRPLVVAGGVAANQFLRRRLEQLAASMGSDFIAPPMKYCTDNAVMIAWAAQERFQAGHRDRLDFRPVPRWPLADCRLDLPDSAQLATSLPHV